LTGLASGGLPIRYILHVQVLLAQLSLRLNPIQFARLHLRRPVSEDHPRSRAVVLLVIPHPHPQPHPHTHTLRTIVLFEPSRRPGRDRPGQHRTTAGTPSIIPVFCSPHPIPILDSIPPTTSTTPLQRSPYRYSVPLLLHTTYITWSVPDGLWAYIHHPPTHPYPLERTYIHTC
jgi:hypothetical protein